MFRKLLIPISLFFTMSCGDGLTYEQKIKKYNFYISKTDSLIQIKDYKKAVAYSNSAIEISDTLPAGFIRKGFASFELNWLDVAEENFDKAIKIEGKQSEVYKLRALVHLKNNDSDFLNDINVYLENHPDDVEAIELRRNYYEEKNDLKSAIKEYSTAIIIDPNNGDLILKRAELFLKNGNWDEAMQDYETILKLDPHNDFVLDKKREIEKLKNDKSNRNTFIFLLGGIYIAYLIISLFVLKPIITRKIKNQIGGEFSIKRDPLIWALPIVLLLIFVVFYFMEIIPTF